MDPTGEYATICIAGVTISVGTFIALLIVGTFLLEYTFNRDFRDGINTFIVRLFAGVIDGIKYLSNVLSDIVRVAKESRKYRGYEDHHIVAQDDSRAAWTKSLIMSYGINTSDRCNVVRISKTLHKHLHTNAYFVGVDIIVRSSAYGRISKVEKRYAIIGSLLSLDERKSSTTLV